MKTFFRMTSFWLLGGLFIALATMRHGKLHLAEAAGPMAIALCIGIAIWARRMWREYRIYRDEQPRIRAWQDAGIVRRFR
jgi:hypothetical protein